MEALLAESRNRRARPAIQLVEAVVQRLRLFPMGNRTKRGFFRAFLDFFILFSGVSTASNLARTQGRPLLTRGLFLFRSRRDA